MKDIKITTVRPVAEPRKADKTAGTRKTEGNSFSDTLQTAVERAKDSKTQAETAISVKGASIEEKMTSVLKKNEELTLAQRKMTLAQQNLSQLYHRIKTTEES